MNHLSIRGIPLDRFNTDKLTTLVREGQNLVDEGERILAGLDREIEVLARKEQLNYQESDLLRQMRDEYTTLTDYTAEIREFCDRAREEIAARKFKAAP